MKKFVVAFTALAALAATPAIAGGTNISFGFYSPAPVYYQPRPVYYQPAPVYYRPAYRVTYAQPYYGRYAYDNHRGHDHGRGHGWGNNRGYNTAWNDRDDRGRGRH